MLKFPYWWPVLLMPAGWILICWLISRIGGWALLARVYSGQDPATLEGERWRFQSMQMRFGSNYGHCVTFRVTSLGLHLSLLWFLRPWHPPLLIPWSDITAQRTRRSRFFPSFVEFKFRLEPSIPIRVSEKLFFKLRPSFERFNPGFGRISSPGEGPAFEKPIGP